MRASVSGSALLHARRNAALHVTGMAKRDENSARPGWTVLESEGDESRILMSFEVGNVPSTWNRPTLIYGNGSL